MPYVLALLLLICLAMPAFAAPASAATVGVETHATAGFDTRLAANVFTAALTFATPRTLDESNPQELTLWGLGGITALDPTLGTQYQDGHVQLSSPDHVVADDPAPARDDAAGWGKLAADMNAAAYAHSATLRAGGTQGLIQGFFDEMFNHLDPYSRYIPPAPAEAERDRLSVDASAGLGLIRRGHGVMVSDVVPGGPGEEAGVRVGDRLLSIAGSSPHTVDQATNLLTGVVGADVAVKLRGLDGLLRDVTITLADVPPETVFARNDGDVLLVRITAFTSNTAERLSQALEAGLANTPPPVATVVDLRGNRGGLLRQAVTAVALFADHGVIASTAGRDPDATHDWRIDGGDLTHGMPVILLVDGRTASAAEIMAASLADLGRGVVVGSATLGKGLVQILDKLPDGGELFVTWSRVLAPRGWPLQSLGVIPQICTSGGESEAQHQMDDLAAGRQDMAAALAESRAARAPLPVAQALEIRAVCPAAEGRDEDLVVAHFLADNPAAYQTALLPPVQDPQALAKLSH